MNTNKYSILLDFDIRNSPFNIDMNCRKFSEQFCYQEYNSNNSEGEHFFPKNYPGILYWCTCYKSVHEMNSVKEPVYPDRSESRLFIQSLKTKLEIKLISWRLILMKFLWVQMVN